MIDRVFDFSQRPCDCVFEDAKGEQARARIFRVSMRRAIVLSKVEFPLHLIIPVKFDFELGPDLDFKARVEGSGDNGLYLELLHPDKDSENLLQTLLIEYSIRERCEDDDPADLDAFFGPDEADIPESHAELAEEDHALRSTILGRTRTVRSKDLAAAHQKVRVLNMSTITDLIGEAVGEAVDSSSRIFDEEERNRLLEEAEGAFQERLADIQAEKAGLIARATRLEDQLGRARGLLEDERKREVRADQFTMSDAGMVELETQLERLFKKIATEGEVPSETEDEMRRIIATLLDEERERQREKEQQAHNEKINLLEHKVGRLAQALQEASDQRDSERRRANALEALGGGGVAGIKIASALGEDPDKGRKLELLKELIADNRAVRSHMGIEPVAAVRSSESSLDDPVLSKTETNDTAETPGDRQPGLLASFAGDGASVAPNGVKKIEVRRVAPPPLEVSS